MGFSGSTARKAVYKNVISTKDLASVMFEAGATAQQFKLKKDVMKKLRVIDATFAAKAKEGFKEKSIPTAALIDVQNELKDPKGRFPNTFPTGEIVKDLLENIGINKSDNIVLYGQVGSVSGPTRAYAVLNTYGFSNVKVLDGGLKKYIADNLPTVPGEDFKGEKTFINGMTYNEDNIADFAFVHDFAQGKHNDYQLLDLRPANEFTGELNANIPGCRPGHVPCAINISMSEFFHQDTQTFKTVEELEKIFEKYRIDKNKKTITMCKTGVAASVGRFVISELGFKDVKLYDGSWSEYGSLDQKK